MIDAFATTWTDLALAAAAAAVAFLDVLPPLGRFIPGHLGVGLVAAAALATTGHASPALLVGAFVGALAGDALAFARARRHPRLVLTGAGDWWLPGGDVDRLERALAKRALRTLVVRRFFTRDRALLPHAAGAWGMPALRYVPLAALACLAWSLAWVAAGDALAAATLRLPPLASLAIATAALLLVSKPFGARRVA